MRRGGAKTHRHKLIVWIQVGDAALKLESAYLAASADRVMDRTAAADHAARVAGQTDRGQEPDLAPHGGGGECPCTRRTRQREAGAECRTALHDVHNALSPPEFAIAIPRDSAYVHSRVSEPEAGARRRRP